MFLETEEGRRGVNQEESLSTHSRESVDRIPDEESYEFRGTVCDPTTSLHRPSWLSEMFLPQTRHRSEWIQVRVKVGTQSQVLLGRKVTLLFPTYTQLPDYSRYHSWHRNLFYWGGMKVIPSPKWWFVCGINSWNTRTRPDHIYLVLWLW